MRSLKDRFGLKLAEATLAIVWVDDFARVFGSMTLACIYFNFKLKTCMYFSAFTQDMLFCIQ